MRVTCLLIPLLFLCHPASAEELTVTSTADDGEGSLREALMLAAESAEPTTVLVTAEGDIRLADGLSYEGSSALTISGDGQTVALDRDATILSIRGGAQLSISGLSLEGPGGWGLENRSAAAASVAGLEVRTMPEQSTDLVVDLRDLSVRGVSGHGIHVSDCHSGASCGGEVEGEGEGSPASVTVFLQNVTVEQTGYGRYDADGLRIDERGAGDVRFTALNANFRNNGADGIELDEGQDGNVVLNVTGGVIEANGGYCDPAILEPALPDPSEAEFDEGELSEADLPAPVSGSADDTCIEFEADLYDDGSVEEYEFEIDVEDGFDVDENGAGSLYAFMSGVTVRTSKDEGLDVDEDGPGDIVGTFLDLLLSENSDDALKLSERAEGSTIAHIDGGSAAGNGDSGYLVEEEGPGDLQATVSNVRTERNDSLGVEIVQEDEGQGSARLIDVDAPDGIELDGVEDQ